MQQAAERAANNNGKRRPSGEHLKWMTSTYVLYTERTTLCFGFTRFGTARKIPVTSTLWAGRRGEGAWRGKRRAPPQTEGVVRFCLSGEGWSATAHN